MTKPLPPDLLPPEEDDDPATPDVVRRRRAIAGEQPPASEGRRGIGSYQAALAFLLVRVGQLREEWDPASENHRRFLAEKVIPELREQVASGGRLLEDLEAFLASGASLPDPPPPGFERCGSCGHLLRLK